MHQSEVTLLALLHGELAPGEAAAVRAHLAVCAACSARAGDVERSDADIGALLGALDHPVPRLQPPAVARGRALRRAAIAASAALFAAGAAAAAVPGTPLHRWIHERLAPAPVPVRPAVAAPVRAVPLEEQATGGIEVPAAGVLTLTFTQPQPGGILTVSAADRSMVTLRSFGGQVAYQVGDDLIVVDNRRPAGRYALEVPLELRRLTIMLGGRVLYRSEGRQPEASAADTISLSKDAE